MQINVIYALKCLLPSFSGQLKTFTKLYKRVGYSMNFTVKPVLSDHSKRRPKLGFQDRLSLNVGQNYCRMHQSEHCAMLSTYIKLPFVI